MEFGLHGVGHEYWADDGIQRRAEWYNLIDREPWPEESLQQHIQDFREIMARELVDEIKGNSAKGKTTRAIIPCGPACWYKSFTDLVNSEYISLKKLVVFHMDECLDWQGQELPRKHPYSFRGFMEENFYNPILHELSIPSENRNWLNGSNIQEIKKCIEQAPVDITYGGWGQDGHIAYNQARRNPFSHITLEDVRNSTVRIQENNPDTVIALAQRTFGSAYKFVPPMSVTLGIKECLSAKKVRLFSDTGAWKQTARIVLYSFLYHRGNKLCNRYRHYEKC